LAAQLAAIEHARVLNGRKGDAPTECNDSNMVGVGVSIDTDKDDIGRIGGHWPPSNGTDTTGSEREPNGIAAFRYSITRFGSVLRMYLFGVNPRGAAGSRGKRLHQSRRR
jgi:hypothetical protein